MPIVRCLSHLLIIAAACLAILLPAGCGRGPSGANQVVLYCSVDQTVARPVIAEFQRKTGITVIVQTDTEATKTTGLSERLEAEKDNPQADVWWGNEVFHTIRLADAGVLASYDSPSAGAIPPRYKDQASRWAGTALRVRVIARATGSEDATRAAGEIDSILDLLQPALKGRICMARPIAGTTRGHIAALYTLWGPARMEQYLNGLKANDIKLLGGNSIVAEMVGRGPMWAGLTDNDDVDAAKREGGQIEMVLPDQQPGGIGTLTMPCTVALVAGARHPEAARKLIDYLLSAEVESKLLQAGFARYSVFADEGAQDVRAMDVDYAKAAANLKPATELAEKVLSGR